VNEDIGEQCPAHLEDCALDLALGLVVVDHAPSPRVCLSTAARRFR
jgi:hypothetical protein